MKELAELHTFADRLTWARTQRNWTQQQLADRLGTRQSTIGSLEKGGRNSSRKTPQIARELGISPDWLATGRGDPHYLGNPETAESEFITHSIQRLNSEETDFMNLYRPLTPENRDTIRRMMRAMQPADSSDPK